jgi:hypothetical protein
MTTEELVNHLSKQAGEIYETLIKPDLAGLPPREHPVAFVGAIGIPLLDWALAELPFHESNDALRIALETMRGTMFGVAETY